MWLCRTLFEVASIERGTAPQQAMCLEMLAGSAHIAKRAHDLAGGFDFEAAVLFAKV